MLTRGNFDRALVRFANDLLAQSNTSSNRPRLQSDTQISRPNELGQVCPSSKLAVIL